MPKDKNENKTNKKISNATKSAALQLFLAQSMMSNDMFHTGNTVSSPIKHGSTLNPTEKTIRKKKNKIQKKSRRKNRK